MSSVPSSDVVILAGRRHTYVWLLDVLRDWSTIGLIGPVHLVDMDALRPGDVRLPCMVVNDGDTRAAVLQNELAGRDRTDLVRVCGLTEVAGDVSGVRDEEALALLQSVRKAVPGVDVVPMHVVGIALQGAKADELLGWLGWHNVVVAPENSQSPSQGVSPIVHSPGDPLQFTHFAAAICSLAGLWTAQPSGPLDQRVIAPGRSLIAARTYTRHLSAEAVESELLARLASVEGGYPAPMLDGRSAWVIDDEVGAVTDMADSLLAKHSYLLPGDRAMPGSSPRKKIGAMEALRMLFVFLGQAMRNAPRAFLDRIVNEVSARTASLVGGVVFGSGDPEYSVVVNGVRADGLPASWTDIDEALEVASAKVRRGGGNQPNQPPQVDLSGFWHDFVDGGLTLIDAGARSTDLPPRMLGSRRGIVSTPMRVAPDPSERFQPPESVAPYLKNDQVSAYDMLAARSLHAQLRVVAEREPHVASEAAAALGQLEEWFGDRERSYSGRVGHTLAKGLHKVRAEITSLAQQFRLAQDAADVPAQIEEQQRRLARKLTVIFGLALLVAVAVVLVTVLGTPEWMFLTACLVGVVLTWLAISFFVFMRGQRDLFALLHQRRDLASRTEMLRQHLIEAIDDMRRLTRAYRQYLDWSRVFGRFVHAPLGVPPNIADSEVLLGSGFSRNHRFGAARPEGAALDEASARIRRETFAVGWAGEAWDVFVSDVPESLGSIAFRIREDRGLLWADPGVTRQSILTAWSDAIAGREDWDGATEGLRTKVSDVLGQLDAALMPRLLAHVETRSRVNGARETVSYEDFMNRLDKQGAETFSSDTFDRAMFSDQAQNSEAWRVAETIRAASSDTLGRTLVVTQLSYGFNGYDLAFAGAGVQDRNNVVEDASLALDIDLRSDRPRM